MEERKYPGSQERQYLSFRQVTQGETQGMQEMVVRSP